MMVSAGLTVARLNSLPWEGCMPRFQLLIPPIEK